MTEGVVQPQVETPRRPLLRRLCDVVPPPPSPIAVPADPAPPLPAPDPKAVPQAERVVRAAVEILGGRRPVRQLSSMLRPDLLAYLVELQAATKPLQPRVHKVLTRRQGTGVLEVVALITLRTGVRALAARFEQLQGTASLGGWRCTALQLRLTPGDVATRRHRCR